MIKGKITRTFYKWQLLQREQLFSRAPPTTAGSHSAKFVHKRLKTKWRLLNFFLCTHCGNDGTRERSSSHCSFSWPRPLASHTFSLYLKFSLWIGHHVLHSCSYLYIASSFCLSFKSCTYCEISKMRIFEHYIKWRWAGLGGRGSPGRAAGLMLAELCTRGN